LQISNIDNSNILFQTYDYNVVRRLDILNFLYDPFIIRGSVILFMYSAAESSVFSATSSIVPDQALVAGLKTEQGLTTSDPTPAMGRSGIRKVMGQSNHPSMPGKVPPGTKMEVGTSESKFEEMKRRLPMLYGRGGPTTGEEIIGGNHGYTTHQ
jgi:hypothetical protein